MSKANQKDIFFSFGCKVNFKNHMCKSYVQIIVGICFEQDDRTALRDRLYQFPKCFVNVPNMFIFQIGSFGELFANHA